jgi:hypothetical protein
MRRTIWGAAVLLAAFAAGCGSAPGDGIVKEQLAVIDQLASAYEKVLDRKSLKEAQPQIQSLTTKIGELDKRLAALGAERKDAALKSNAAELEQAWGRMKAAKEKAGKVR